MTVKSTYPAIDIPELDLWTFFFERKDRAYPDTKGMVSFNEYRIQRLWKSVITVNSTVARCRHQENVHICAD